MSRAFALAVFSLALVACAPGTDPPDGPDAGADAGPDDGANEGACASLCRDAGFDGGEEVDFGGGVVECTCAGAGAGLSQSGCADYCAPLGVNADAALLSTEVVANDKCVCDGTQASTPEPPPEGLHANCALVYDWLCTASNKCSDKNVDFTNQCEWARTNQCAYCAATISSFAALESTCNWTETLPASTECP